MDYPLIYVGILVILPLIAALLTLTMKSPWQILNLATTIVGIVFVTAIFIAKSVFTHGPIAALDDWVLIDALSAFHLATLAMIFFLSSVYARIYFCDQIASGQFDLTTAKWFGSLWLASLATMVVVLISNNMGIMWVGIETTTLTTAFLISLKGTPLSLEAMWKYLMICSVGVAFSFIGLLLICAATHPLHLEGYDMLLWTKLMANPLGLNMQLVKLGFIFLLVGYGTKAGLFPMHGWLPDAYSQTPAPVTAIFTGFSFNTVFYCIMRYLPLVESATGNVGWARHLLLVFGLISILAAAAFVIAQNDVKRMLAYSSVEHLGIVSLGLGLGGLGVFAALFHTLNHSLAKSLSFFAVGRVCRIYGTHDMRLISAMLVKAPLWGHTLFLGLFVLIGMVPFAMFISEILILKAAFAKGALWTAGLFLLGVSIVFIAIMHFLIAMAFGKQHHQEPKEAVSKPRAEEVVLVTIMLGLLLILGLFMPEFLKDAINQASHIVGGGL